jgi:2-polyprenyl-3-methyl-5-hydroxy-6-metoxy-1,4-benzoquinol methylase
MKYEQMLSKNIGTFKEYYAHNKNPLRYPNEYLVRFYHSYLKNNIRPRGKILDFGYGSGNNTVFLMERGYEVHGIEIAEAAQKLLLDDLDAKGFGSALAKNFSIIDPYAINLTHYEDNSYDFILSNMVLYYYPSENAIRQICMELMKRLRPGGVVFFTMCGIKSSILSDAQLTGQTNVYRVGGKGERSALDGQYLYLVPDEKTMESLFSMYEKEGIGHIEEELFGRRDFIWIFVGKKPVI